MNRKLFIIIAIIITVSIGSAYIVQAHGPGRGRGKGFNRDFRQRDIGPCLDELDLTPGQIEQLSQIRKEHQENMEQIGEEMAETRSRQRFNLRKGEEAAQGQEDLIEKGGDLWKERGREKLEYHRQIWNLLTQEQRDKLENLKISRSRSGWCGKHPGDQSYSTDQSVQIAPERSSEE